LRKMKQVPCMTIKNKLLRFKSLHVMNASRVEHKEFSNAVLIALLAIAVSQS
jgi:hypothetical protein